MNFPKEWIGVDLDGTLAYYDGEWRGVEHIGEPIMPMVRRIKRWLKAGKEVRIFTARVADMRDATLAAVTIQDWCEKHIGQRLNVTCVKDRYMSELWDDRAVRVVKNTGTVDPSQELRSMGSAPQDRRFMAAHKHYRGKIMLAYFNACGNIYVPELKSAFGLNAFSGWCEVPKRLKK